MMKLSKKSKYAWLAMAITASLLGGSVVEAAQTMTNFTTPLTGNSDNDIDYEDAGVLDGSTYTFSKESTITVSNADAISVKSDVTINAESAPLHINAGRYAILGGTPKSNLTINAKELDLSVKQDESVYSGSDTALIKCSYGKLTINGDVNGTVESVTNQGSAQGINVAGGELTINGNVTMKKDGGWGISYSKDPGFEPMGIWVSGSAGKVTINGLVDMTVNGTALETSAEGTEITVKGGHFTTNKDSDNTTISTVGMVLTGGTINLNVNEDKTDAGDAETVLVGDIKLEDSKSHVNFGLSTKDSKWTGVADNADGANGTINLYLKNGGTWDNAVTGMSYGHVSSNGSYVTKLTGGSDDATAGNIFMKDTHDTTVENYSGYTNIYYAHEGNGETAENYTAGNITIKSAAEGSVVSLITDNTGVNMNSDARIADVLNALAGKLTYSGYANKDEKDNLKGYVKIADGLTASSKALQVGDITFNEKGQGTYVKKDNPVQTEFTTAITADGKIDDYDTAGVRTSTGNYQFTKDATVTVKGTNAINAEGWDWEEAVLKVNAADLDLNLNTDQRGIYAKFADVEVTAKTLNITAEGGNSRDAALVYNDRSKVTVNGNIVGTVDGSNIGSRNVASGLYASGSSATTTINGNFTAKKDEGYGITGSKNVTGINAVSSATINVNGDVDMTVNGTGINAESKGTVNINGATNIAVSENNKALNANGGTINVNMNADQTAAADKDVTITGQVNGNVNLGLNTAASVLEGQVTGANLWLANGATWKNSGESTVAKLVGGTAGQEGNIYAGSGKLTISDYSGYTNIFYDHEGNGEEAANYTAGDTIITSAKEGSVVTLITDSENVNINNIDSVANVLNALAGKLTYSNFVNGENNLTGKVKIAEGLTSSSKELEVKDITFDATTGQGTYQKPKPATDFTTTLTGVKEDDTEYASVIANDGTYYFKEDTTISTPAANGIHTNVQHMTTNIDATGKTLHVISGKNGVLADVGTITTINADTLDVTINQDMGVYNGSVGAIVAGQAAKLTINGNVTGSVVACNTSGYSEGLHAANGELTINGNVTFKKEGGWGLTYDHSNSKYNAPIGLRAYSAGLQKGTLTINGIVDMTVDGDVISTSSGGIINVKGGTMITNADSTDDEQTFLGMNVSSGTVNVNMNDTKTDAGDTKTVLVGDIYVGYENSHVKLGLSTADSSWSGVAGKDAKWGQKNTDINLYLKNGATWINDPTGSRWGIKTYTGSALTILSGGSSENTAGNIFMKDTHDTTVDNYSGYTNVYYAHTGDGEDAEDYAAGNFTIKKAAEGATISLITDNTGVNMDSDDSVSYVLNALAGKLTYSGFASGETNLTGYVKIADGLTASSKAMRTGNITFDENGKGTYPSKPKPKTEFTMTLTGDTEADTEYANNIEDGNYVFGADTTINADGQTAVDVTKTPLTIDAGENTLTLKAQSGDSTYMTSIFNQTSDGTTKVTAGKLVIGEDSASDSYNRSGMTIKSGEVDITAKDVVINAHSDNKTSAAYGIQAINKGSKVTIHGDLTLQADGDGTVKGLYVEDQSFFNGTGAHITVDGKADINVATGTAISAYRNGSSITVGGGTIQIGKQTDKESYVLLSDGGVINVNMNADKNAAGTMQTVLQGNVSSNGRMAYANYDDTKDSIINVGLSGADSSWTGAAFVKDANATLKFLSYLNLYLNDGATWNNEVWGKVNDAFDGSHVTKFVGGGSEGKAGNIFMKDTHATTIDNYSGYTNIYYAHEGNGETAENYTAGDTIIKAAAENSVVSLITDNTGVNMDSDDSVSNVLNALAGKLTYSAWANDEKNLTGYVKIADGLTASSKALQTGNIAFSTENGKGSYADGTMNPGFAPDHQVKTAFTTTLTGVKDSDSEYDKGGVIAEDGTYKFTEDSSITTTNAHGADMNQATTIDAKGKTLTFNTNVTDSSTIHAIGANSTDGVTITANKLVLNANSTKGRVEAINVGGQGQQNKDKPMKLTINGDTEMNVKGINYALGLYAAGNSEVTFNGNVTAMGNEDSEWGLTSEKGAFGYYGCSLVYSGSNYSLQMGPKVTINGDVNAKIDGNGLFANGGHAKLTINGGGNIEINKDNKHNYYALLAECGTTSLNVNLNDNYQATSARDNKLVLKGNVTASTGAINVNEPELYTYVNLGLATADSEWTGVAYNKFGDAGKVKGDKTFYGAINVFLQNGATWNNEEWGAVEKSAWGAEAYNGSHLAKLIGGESEAKAGNIFQKDANSLTIDNYSGNTNIFYAHTGNGEAASDYAAGDTVIRSAAEGSAVSLITDNSGIAMDNEYSVANVLNTLAGKLTYSSFVTGEKNLTGYVKIADGLTASSAAMQTGNIAFSDKDGKGSLENGSMKPGFTYPETQKPEATEKNQGITGDAKTDYQYKKDGILKEDGSYVFTQNPTKIEVESGAAVDATENNINIDSTQAKLELKGETGIHANGADVTVKGNTGISGKVGIDAANGNVTLNGSTDIVGTDAAINAGEGGNVDINTNNSALNIKGDINADGGSITVDSGKATGVIDGDVSASNGGSVEISLNDAKSSLTGSYRVDDSSSIVMNIANGATWNLTDDEDDAEGMSLFRMAKAPAAAADKGLTINGGESKAKTGYLNMTKRTKDLNIASYSGWETIIYGHENAGDKDEDYKSGNTIINKAAKDSGVILSTDNSGINMEDKAAVEATLKALAHKLTYTDHEENGSNLTGKVQIADGLTASSASKYLGNMRWDENGKGQYVVGSIQREPTIETGDYETFVMKGARSAVTTSFHSWRDNMQDTYTGADLADEDGIFAKALGGKTSSDVSGLKDSNSYWGAQIGYDKALANGWHTGVAFDYRDGDSDYLLGGKGDNKLYSFGVYGVKKMDNGSYFRVAAKAGRVENEYDVYTELRNKLHADYKANAYGLTAEYGKTFGSEMSYITPKVQLTWSRVGSKDYTGSANNGATMNIYQDSYDSLVGRLGFEAGMKKAHGSLHAGLYLAHEFNGDIDTRYFAKDGGWKSTSFDGDDTWAELVLGGEYSVGRNSKLYADFARDLGGDFQRKWKLNAGIRLRF